MRFLLRLSPKGQPPQDFLRTVRAFAMTVGSEARNPKWTSYGALEVDIFAPSRPDFELFTSIVEPISSIEFTRDLNVAPEHKDDESLFMEAWGYFNSERYWECHEVLEGIWRARTGQEKLYLQGLILVCAAFVHHQKGEETVARSVLLRATRQLSYPEAKYHGLDVERFSKEAGSILQSGRFGNFRV